MSETPENQEGQAPKKEGIVVNPFAHKKAEEPGNEQKVDGSSSQSTNTGATDGTVLAPSLQSTPENSGSSETPEIDPSIADATIVTPPVPDPSVTSLTPIAAAVAADTPASGTATGTVIDPAAPLIVAPVVTPAETDTTDTTSTTPSTTENTDELNRLLATLLKDVTTPAKMAINTILEYIEKMKPGKPIAVKDGTSQQVRFYQALLTIINNLEGDFRPTLQAVLALLHHHRDGVFRETHVFRFVEHVPLSKENQRGFQKIVTLLKTVADPQSRSAVLKQIDFEPLLKFGLTEKGRVRLSAFFGK